MKTKLTGQEKFIFNNAELSTGITDFWSYKFSNLLQNITRSAFGEYLVASSLGKTSPHGEGHFEAYDIEYNGIKIEVKTSAYLQHHGSEKLSNLGFSIAPAKKYIPNATQTDEKTENEFTVDKARWSDVYVFCVLAEKDKAKANPLNLDQWEFYVCSARVLDELCGEGKTLSESKLNKLPTTKTKYGDELKNAIETIYNENKGKTITRWQ